MMSALIQKIIDNIQISVKNIHLRVESENLEDQSNSFSLGITLKSLNLETTDAQWKKQFIDRNLNKELPLFKLLKIDNFAIYYKTNEPNFIQNSDKQLQAFIDLSKTIDDRIPVYQNDYLLEPIKLEVKMQQFDAVQALANVTSGLSLNIELHSIGICLQKQQYDCLLKLLELISEYSMFCNTETLKQKQLDLKSMQDILKQDHEGVITKRQVKASFIKLYKAQLQQVVKWTLDDKYKEKLQKALKGELKTQFDLYRSIICAIDVFDLQTWADQVASDLAEAFKKEKIIKQSSSYFSGWFGSPKTEEIKTDKETELLKKIEADVILNLETEQSMHTKFANIMKNIPQTKLHFVLNEFKLTLQNDEHNGLQAYSNGFSVMLCMFDASNKYNNHTMEFNLHLQEFGVDVLKQNQTIPLIQQMINQNLGDKKALKLCLALGNLVHQQSDLPQDQIEDIDLDLHLVLKPVEIIYQSGPIEAISKFFQVRHVNNQSNINRHMNDKSKKQAQEQFLGLANQVSSIQKTLEADMKNNKIQIQIDSPCLVLPFQQNSQEEINKSECWVFRMGDFDFSTKSDHKGTDLRFHEVFELKVQRIKFEHIDRYELWKQTRAVKRPLLKDFDTSLNIIKKRDIDEMKNQEMRILFQQIKTPQTQIQVQFDSKILLQLQPDLFVKLCSISDLLTKERHQQQFYIDRMNQRLNDSIFWSIIKKENYYMQWSTGTACLLKPGILFFYDDYDITKEFEYSLDGAECVLEGQEIKLLNINQQHCKLQLSTPKQAARWQSELIQAAEEIKKIKELFNEKQIDLIDDDQEENCNVIDTESEDRISTLKFSFKCPSIELQILTEQKSDQGFWVLYIQLEQLSVTFKQTLYESFTKLSIQSLKVTDNSGDLRFPCIFQNEQTEELLSILFKTIQEESPLYMQKQIGSELNISFGGLVVNWKPQCVKYLVQFLNTQAKVKKEKVEVNIDQLIDDLNERKNSLVYVTKKMVSCKTKKDSQLHVKLNLMCLNIVFIHPENHTYPIFNMKLGNLYLGYNKKCDHDSVTMQITNFQVFDNLNYPETLNPFKTYQNEPLIQNEIMGLNTETKTDQMLDLNIVIFTYPGENGCCDLQPSKDYNLQLKVEMSQLKLVFMQEQTIRMLDYILFQVSALISQNTQDEIEEETVDNRSKIIKKDSKQWENFNLQQTNQGADLQINIHSPVIIIPNFSKESGHFVIDFGHILVSSQVQNQLGRWLNFKNKPIYTTQYLILNRDMRFEYHSIDKVETIWNEDTLDIVITMVNPSPFFIEYDDDIPYSQRRYAQVKFDLNQVDTSMKIEIELKVFLIKLQQNTLNAMFDILNTNISFNDQYSKYFKQSLVRQVNEKVKEVVKITNNRKSMDLIVQSNCLILEIRDSEEVLITEICIINLDFSQTSYMNGRQLMKLEAGRLFMFHDETENSNYKQIMIGHYDAKGEVETDKDFYENMFRNTRLEDSANFKFIQEFKASGDSEMYVELCKIKIYIRQEVFKKLSKFFVSGLSRMKPVQEEVVKQDKNPSAAQSKMEVKVSDTLFIIENSNVGKMSIVLQISLDVLMESLDPKMLKLILEPNKSRLYQLIKVDINSIAACFCNTNDLLDNGFDMAEKREILQPLELHLNQEITLKNDFPIRFMHTSVMTLNLADISLKLSMDDLYTMKAISDQQMCDLAIIQQIWAKEIKEPIVEENKVESEDKNISSSYLNSNKIQLLIINEYEGAYVPLFFIQLAKMNFTAQSDTDQKQSGSYFQVNLEVDYFNPNSGCYEPVVEQFPVTFKQISLQKNSDMTIALFEPLRINVSPDLATNIAVVNRLWALSQQQAAKYERKMNDQKLGLTSRNGTMLKSTMRSKSIKSMPFKTTSTLLEKHRQLTIREQVQKEASPYAIRNLTTQALQVYSVDNNGKELLKGYELINADEVRKIASLNKQMNENNVQRGETEMDLFVKIKFQDPNMRPVQRLNLNKNNSMTFFNVYDATRESLILQSKLEDNKRVLTIRSLCILKNQTKVQYHVKIFYVDLDKIVILQDKRLEPNQSMSLPDHEDKSINSKMKIAIRPKQCKKWSQEFKVDLMKTRVQSNVNIIWQHYQTYSILRKLPTSLKGSFDMVLQPAMNIINCLPSTLKIEMHGKLKDKKTFIKQVILEKQEEIQFEQITKFTDEIIFTIDLGSQFNTSEVTLLADVEKQGDITVKMTDKNNRPFIINIRVDTTKAGLWLVFFCDNLLSCQTSQKLEFHYSRNLDSPLPMPIINEPENVLIIFDKTKEIYARISNEFSDKIQCGTVGTVGDFTVPNQQSSFNFAYATKIWSVSETEYVSTKILEIQPQFIVCNLTNQELLFTQVDTDNFQKLLSNQRAPYHWQDHQKAQLLYFKVKDSELSPGFSLKEVGTKMLCCKGETKLFFRITKKMVNESIFCIIEESQSPPYLIKNQLDISLKVNQDQESFIEDIQPGSELGFAWTNFLNDEPQLQVQFLEVYDELLIHEYKPIKQKYLFSLDKLNEFEKIVLECSNSRILTIFVSIYRDSGSKVIEFSGSASQLLRKSAQEAFEDEKEPHTSRKHILEGKDKSTFTLEIAQINVSCIISGIEVLTIFLHDLQVKQATTDTDSIIELFLGRFQIDNNQRIDTLYQVMMKPKCLTPQQEHHDHFTMLNVDPVFQFYIHSKLNVPNVTYYEIIEWLVKELEVKIEVDHIYGIMEWVFAVQANLNASLTTISPLFKKQKRTELDESYIEDKVKTWRDEDITKSDEQFVYIKHYKGSPFSLELSLFKQTATSDGPKHGSSAFGGVVSNIANMGINLTSLNNAPIKLDALEISNVYGSQIDITTQLTAHYYGNIKTNIGRILASTDLIGNPYNMVNSLGTGVKKFYYEPRNGFMEGPLQGGLGIIKGTAGMVGITAATGLGGLGKITNSLNKGIIAASLDKDYIHQKEINDIRNKPTGVLTGMGEGAKGLGIAVLSGVTGVVVKPIEGAQKSGVTGFFSGVGKGLLGVVFKPVSGVVDLFSKTTYGIEQSATGIPECKQNNERMRQPRPFYSNLNIIKNYNPMHAQVYIQLNSKSDFLGAYKCGVGKIDSKITQIELGSEILVITTNFIYGMAHDYSILYQIDFSEIKTVIFDDQTFTQPKVIFLHTKDKARQLKQNQREFSFIQFENFQECRGLIQEILNAMKKLDS